MPAVPVPRPTWLRVAVLAASVGLVAWPVLALLGLLGIVPAQTVLNVGIVVAVLAYVSIRRIKRDREIATGGADPSEPPPEG